MRALVPDAQRLELAAEPRLSPRRDDHRCVVLAHRLPCFIDRDLPEAGAPKPVADHHRERIEARDPVAAPGPHAPILQRGGSRPSRRSRDDEACRHRRNPPRGFSEVHAMVGALEGLGQDRRRSLVMQRAGNADRLGHAREGRIAAGLSRKLRPQVRREREIISTGRLVQPPVDMELARTLRRRAARGHDQSGGTERLNEEDALGVDVTAVEIRDQHGGLGEIVLCRASGPRERRRDDEDPAAVGGPARGFVAETHGEVCAEPERSSPRRTLAATLRQEADRGVALEAGKNGIDEASDHGGVDRRARGRQRQWAHDRPPSKRTDRS
jgi:hypothetical protein